MNSIGGYFSIECQSGIEYHSTCLKLNSGRNAFALLLERRLPKRIFLPYFLCSSLERKTIEKGVKIENYALNSFLEPDREFEKEDYIVYVNYFGIKDRAVLNLRQKYRNLIVDNCQSFYSKPLPDTDTFNSPRKFFGIGDGSYLFTSSTGLTPHLSEDSTLGLSYLVKALDCGTEATWKEFQNTEQKLADHPILLMSPLSEKILKSIDYENNARIRRENFIYLNNYFKEFNKIPIALANNQVPMAYPLYFDTGEFKSFILLKKIYVGTYWKEVLTLPNVPNGEKDLVKGLTALPIDQRYTIEDMKYIISLHKDFKSQFRNNS